MRPIYCLLAAIAWPLFVHAQTNTDDLFAQPIEALLDTEVSSVLKHSSGLADAPAAVTVIRREDIERLGATTLPDLLRIVPGLSVAQIDGNKWAIGARGFNGFFGSKLLVLIDGRSIYNRTFAGVFWDAYDIPFDSIARIEVIRGPAGVLWGSNAVNGVINIVTRSAQETTGGRLEVTAGNVEKHLTDLRYGGGNESASWRVYARERDRDQQRLPDGTSPNDVTRADRVGFRADSAPGGATTWMLTGDAHQGHSGGVGIPQPTTEDFKGHHLLGRVTHQISSASNIQLQLYYDHSWRKDIAIGSELQEDVFDIDFIHDTVLSPAHRLTWGGGWREYRFTSVGSTVTCPGCRQLSFAPSKSNNEISNLFIQDEWNLIPRELLVVAGLRAEQLPTHGVQWQPNLRIAWTPWRDHTFWAATAKAVRAPNEYNTGIRFTGLLGSHGTSTIWGRSDYVPEEAVSLEAGWRAQLSPRLASDLSIYRNRYRHLETIELMMAPQPHLAYFNHAKGTTEGVEWALDWQVADNWQLRGGASLYKENLTLADAPPSLLPSFPLISFRASSPTRQGFLRSLWDINRNHRFDITLRGVGPLKERGVPGYGTMDFRWTWRFDKNMEFSLTGRNLTGPMHSELADQPYFVETMMRRELFGTVSINF